MEPMTIRKIIEGTLNGQIRIPAFQREFVWEPERVALFIDSVYKQYPFGSLLFWRAGELLNHEKQLGPYALPDLKDEYPIDYVLDGQQRVTSIFASFQTELDRPAEEEWTDIYFDYRSGVDPQDSSFFALPASEADPAQFFPVSVLFDSTAYRKATEGVDETLVSVIDELQTRIKEALIPVELLRTDDQAKVAIVFERINHQGVPLDTLQLLTAWTWSDDFDLQQRFEDLREALEEHGFAGVGEDTSLVLRCCAAILVGQPTSDHLIQLNGSEVRDNFGRIENGIKGAIDFLRAQLGVETLRNMPYPAMLIPLSTYFASDGNEQVVVPDADREALQRWFWRSCFSERYSGQTNRVARNDIAEMVKLRNGEGNSLGDFTIEIGSDFFKDTVFRLGSARSATFVLLLASRKPRSFISGSLVNLEQVLQAYNRHEFHHMYPRKMLREDGFAPAEINCLANMCILSRVDNNQVKASPPSAYKDLMPDGTNLDAILEASVATPTLFNDDFYAFRDERADALAEIARALIA
ncbi:MAG TPA: DUF262 domain-containing protein [Solirubrobacterales bacterium]|nr:DUF262 domain-containing protein [Solirubrobacterales bacterium]